MPGAMLVFGGLLFGVSGLLHAWYMLRDIQRPRSLVPDHVESLGRIQFQS